MIQRCQTEVSLLQSCTNIQTSDIWLQKQHTWQSPPCSRDNNVPRCRMKYHILCTAFLFVRPVIKAAAQKSSAQCCSCASCRVQASVANSYMGAAEGRTAPCWVDVCEYYLVLCRVTCVLCLALLILGCIKVSTVVEDQISLKHRLLDLWKSQSASQCIKLHCSSPCCITLRQAADSTELPEQCLNQAQASLDASN